LRFIGVFRAPANVLLQEIFLPTMPRLKGNYL
jgi:hypothetical protein